MTARVLALVSVLLAVGSVYDPVARQYGFETGGGVPALASLDNSSCTTLGDSARCTPEAVVGCSVPPSLQMLLPWNSVYIRAFHSACVRHDYCFRHGSATYGMTRVSCNSEFRSRMAEVCARSGNGPATSPLLQGSSALPCHLMAEAFHVTVSMTGHWFFMGGRDSSYFEYETDRLAARIDAGTTAFTKSDHGE